MFLSNFMDTSIIQTLMYFIFLFIGNTNTHKNKNLPLLISVDTSICINQTFFNVKRDMYVCTLSNQKLIQPLRRCQPFKAIHFYIRTHFFLPYILALYSKLAICCTTILFVIIEVSLILFHGLWG